MNNTINKKYEEFEDFEAYFDDDNIDVITIEREPEDEASGKMELVGDNNTNYVRTYFDNFSKYPEIQKFNGTDFIILNYLLQKMDYINASKAYGGNTISISASAKKDICEVLGITTHTFETSIRKYKKACVIRNIEGKQGLYQVNPFLWAKGSEKDISDFKFKAVKNGWFSMKGVKIGKITKIL